MCTFTFTFTFSFPCTFAAWTLTRTRLFEPELGIACDTHGAPISVSGLRAGSQFICINCRLRPLTHMLDELTSIRNSVRTRTQHACHWPCVRSTRVLVANCSVLTPAAFVYPASRAVGSHRQCVCRSCRLLGTRGALVPRSGEPSRLAPKSVVCRVAHSGSQTVHAAGDYAECRLAT